MYKTHFSFNRIIGVLPLSNSILTRTRNFIPDYAYTDNFVDTKYFDEIVILKIDNDTSEEALDLHAKAISRFMRDSALPLTLGGNVSSIRQADLRFEWGADRIMIGQNLMSNHNALNVLAARYGSQALVGCINYQSNRMVEESEYLEKIGQLADRYESLGIGELILTAVDRDGTLQGLDLILPEYVGNSIDIPIILNGGLGNWKHVEDAFSKQNIAGVCTSNIFHLSTSAIQSMKRNLYSRGVRVRYEQ